MPTLEQDAWLANPALGVKLPPRAAKTEAAPAAGGGAPKGSQAGRPSRATGTVTITLVGDFVYFVDSVPLVEPVISEIADEYSAAAEQYSSLTSAVDELEILEEKYQNTTESDIQSEIYHYATHELKNEGGAARGADITDSGFKEFLTQLNEELSVAKENVKVTSDDLKAADLLENAAEAKRIGMEMQEHEQALIEGFTKVLETSAHVVELVAAPEAEALEVAPKVLELAADVFSTFSAGSNDWLKQAAKLEADANRLKRDGLESRVKMAKQTVQTLQKGVTKWQPIVARASHDLETKANTRDDDYDAIKDDGKTSKSFEFGEIKKGVELAKNVYDLGKETLGNAAKAHTLVIGVQRVHAKEKPEEWMAKPAQCQKVLDDVAKRTHEMGQFAEAKIQWSRALLKRFETFYSVAAEAVADAPGTHKAGA